MLAVRQETHGAIGVFSSRTSPAALRRPRCRQVRRNAQPGKKLGCGPRVAWASREREPAIGFGCAELLRTRNLSLQFRSKVAYSQAVNGRCVVCGDVASIHLYGPPTRVDANSQDSRGNDRVAGAGDLCAIAGGGELRRLCLDRGALRPFFTRCRRSPSRQRAGARSRSCEIGARTQFGTLSRTVVLQGALGAGRANADNFSSG